MFFAKLPDLTGKTLPHMLQQWQDIFLDDDLRHLKTDDEIHEHHLFMTAFSFKALFHLMQLESVRENLVVVGLAGLKNCGKTTLAQKLLGTGLVTDEPGLDPHSTTWIPKIYSFPGAPRVFVVDLPGIDDEDTLKFVEILMPTINIGVYALSADSPPHPPKQDEKRRLFGDLLQNERDAIEARARDIANSTA